MKISNVQFADFFQPVEKSYFLTELTIRLTATDWPYCEEVFVTIHRNLVAENSALPGDDLKEIEWTSFTGPQNLFFEPNKR